MLFILFILLLMPVALFGYLDPGSGAVLINLLITAAAALLYSLKGLFFRLLGKKQAAQPKRQGIQLALLSEGKSYRLSFQPLIEALTAREIHFAYYTLDIEDPLLKIDNPFCHNRFLGFGALGKYRASNLKEALLLSTTPNISCAGYPIKRSPHTRKLIHFFHSLIDLSMYRKGSLDFYDAVILPGDYHIAPIRHLEKLRGLKEKELISLGAPYLDLLAEEKAAQTPFKQEKCLLVASSWGDKGLLTYCGIEPFLPLAEKGWELIIRPHPQDLKKSPELILKLQKQSAAKPNIIWDFALSGAQSMQKASLMLSDTSSIRFDFAFLYEKPVLSLVIPAAAMPGFERDDLSEIWSEGAAQEIGMVIDSEALRQDPEGYLLQTLQSFDAARIRSYRHALVRHFGTAASAIADYLALELESLKSL